MEGKYGCEEIGGWLIIFSDSEPVEETPTPRPTTTKVAEVVVQPLDPPTLPLAGTVPDITPVHPPPGSTSHRKGGRPPNARKGKLGKNQYTKDRDPPDDDQSPGRSQSRDITRGDENGHSASNRGSINESKVGKSKGGNSKVSFTDMRRRVAAILDFIARTQLEMAGESMASISAEATGDLMRGIAESLPMIRVNGDKGEIAKDGDGGTMERNFNDLTCLEMMDALTRQLVKWQNEFT